MFQYEFMRSKITQNSFLRNYITFFSLCLYFYQKIIYTNLIIY